MQIFSISPPRDQNTEAMMSYINIGNGPLYFSLSHPPIQHSPPYSHIGFSWERGWSLCFFYCCLWPYLRNFLSLPVTTGIDGESLQWGQRHIVSGVEGEGWGLELLTTILLFYCCHSMSWERCKYKVSEYWAAPQKGFHNLPGLC